MSNIPTQTACKPSAKCTLCAAGHRRYLRSHFNVRSFFHHISGPEFPDCEDQTYERVTFGAYEHKPAPIQRIT